MTQKILFIQQYLGNKKQITKFQEHRRNSYQNNVRMDGIRKQSIDLELQVNSHLLKKSQHF